MPIWQYALPVWGALTSDTQMLRIQRLQNKINIGTVEEIFQTASKRFANALSCHINPEARQLVLQPYEPQRLQRPRYAKQLQLHIRPLQPQRHGQRQQQAQTTMILPTLLRLEDEELEVQREAQRKKEQEEANERCLKKLRQQNIDNPRPERFGSLEINCLRRRYASGQTTRERLALLIYGQPLIIQRIILPDYEGDTIIIEDDPEPSLIQDEGEIEPQQQQPPIQNVLPGTIDTRPTSTHSAPLAKTQEALLDVEMELLRRRLEHVMDDEGDAGNVGNNDDDGNNNKSSNYDDNNDNEQDDNTVIAAANEHIRARSRRRQRLLEYRTLSAPRLLCQMVVNLLIIWSQATIPQVTQLQINTYQRRTGMLRRHPASRPPSTLMEWKHHGIRPPEMLVARAMGPAKNAKFAKNAKNANLSVATHRAPFIRSCRKQHRLEGGGPSSHPCTTLDGFWDNFCPHINLNGGPTWRGRRRYGCTHRAQSGPGEKASCPSFSN